MKVIANMLGYNDTSLPGHSTTENHSTSQDEFDNDFPPLEEPPPPRTLEDRVSQAEFLLQNAELNMKTRVEYENQIAGLKKEHLQWKLAKEQEMKVLVNEKATLEQEVQKIELEKGNLHLEKIDIEVGRDKVQEELNNLKEKMKQMNNERLEDRKLLQEEASWGDFGSNFTGMSMEALSKKNEEMETERNRLAQLRKDLDKDRVELGRMRVEINEKGKKLSEKSEELDRKKATLDQQEVELKKRNLALDQKKKELDMKIKAVKKEKKQLSLQKKSNKESPSVEKVKAELLKVKKERDELQRFKQDQSEQMEARAIFKKRVRALQVSNERLTEENKVLRQKIEDTFPEKSSSESTKRRLEPSDSPKEPPKKKRKIQNEIKVKLEQTDSKPKKKQSKRRKKKDHEMFEVERILKRVSRTKIRIRWKGYGPDHDSDEPVRNFKDLEIYKKFCEVEEEEQKKQREASIRAECSTPIAFGYLKIDENWRMLQCKPFSSDELLKLCRKYDRVLMGNAMKTRRSKSSDAMPPRIRDRIIVFKALQANEKTLVLLRWWDFREEKLKKMTAEDFKNEYSDLPHPLYSDMPLEFEKDKDVGSRSTAQTKNALKSNSGAGVSQSSKESTNKNQKDEIFEEGALSPTWG